MAMVEPLHVSYCSCKIIARRRMPQACSPNASIPCPWPRVSLSPATTMARALGQRRCLGNAVGLTTLSDVLEQLHAFQRRAHPDDSDREGGSPPAELESWLTSPTAAEAPRRICEIGVNSGESAAAWLCAYPQASYLGFDLMRFNATVDAAAFLTRTFPNRVSIVAGNTLETLPRHALAHPGTCDVLSIDGGHSFQVALSDLSYARVLASDRHTVVMDDLRCVQWWCKPPTAVWQYFKHRRALHERDCRVAGCCTGWCWGRFDLEAPQPEASGVCGPNAARSKHGKTCLLKAQSLLLPNGSLRGWHRSARRFTSPG